MKGRRIKWYPSLDSTCNTCLCSKNFRKVLIAPHNTFHELCTVCGLRDLCANSSSMRTAKLSGRRRSITNIMNEYISVKQDMDGYNNAAQHNKILWYEVEEKSTTKNSSMIPLMTLSCTTYCYILSLSTHRRFHCQFWELSRKSCKPNFYHNHDINSEKYQYQEIHLIFLPGFHQRKFLYSNLNEAYLEWAYGITNPKSRIIRSGKEQWIISKKVNSFIFFKSDIRQKACTRVCFMIN